MVVERGISQIPETVAEHVAAPRLSIRRQAEIYLQSREDLTPVTQAAYRNDLREFSSYLEKEGLTDMNRVTPDHVAGFFQDEKGKYAPATIDRRKPSVRAFLNSMKSDVDQDTLKRLEAMVDAIPKFVLKPGERKCLSKEGAEAFLKAPLEKAESAKTRKEKKIAKRDATFIDIAIKTGASVSEIVGLKRSDIELPKREDDVCFIQFKKESGASRTVPLDTQSVPIVSSYLNEVNLQPDDYLFHDMTNHKSELGHVGRGGAWLIIKGYSSGTDVTSRELRNTFVKYYFQGETVGELAYQLGISRGAASRMAREVGRDLKR